MGAGEEEMADRGDEVLVAGVAGGLGGADGGRGMAHEGP